MFLSKISNNFHILRFNNCDFAFSYDKLVAVFEYKNNHLSVLNKKFSKTTSKHINMFIKTYKTDNVTKEYYDEELFNQIYNR